MTEKANRTVDRILFLLPIAIIAIFFIHTWWTNTAPSKSAVGLTFAAIIIVATFSALWTKEIGARGIWIVKRQEKPGLFQAVFGAQLLLAVLILFYAFI